MMSPSVMSPSRPCPQVVAWGAWQSHNRHKYLVLCGMRGHPLCRVLKSPSAVAAGVPNTRLLYYSMWECWLLLWASSPMHSLYSHICYTVEKPTFAIEIIFFFQRAASQPGVRGWCGAHGSSQLTPHLLYEVLLFNRVWLTIWLP